MELPLIQNKIYQIHGQKIKLDFDLAERQEAETGVLNQAAKRNAIRFPEGFIFRLTKEEWTVVRSSPFAMSGQLQQIGFKNN
jgi:hypothetical protein